MEASSPAPSPPESHSARILRDIFVSGRPLVYVQTSEERRVGRLLEDAALHDFAAPVPLWTWSLTEGLQEAGGAHAAPDTTAPRAALDFIAGYKGPALFQLKDFHEPLARAADVRRRLRDLDALCRAQGKFVVVTSPVHAIPEELERTILFVELGVPDLVELEGFVAGEAATLAATGLAVDASAGTRRQVARALQGLTLEEAGFALQRAVAATHQFGTAALPLLFDEKRLLVNRLGTIEYVGDGREEDRVGGLQVMKRWLAERRPLFEAREGLNAELVPKGVLVMGVSGCGKSLSVRAIAATFGLPLYRIDMTEIFSGRHGTPEWAFARACRTMEELAPAVVWFDEIEMGITSAESTGEQGRIFAFFLTWMQEKVRGLFVAATANRIDLLPAEMIRKGRFDEVFFVDLPHDKERLEIFGIHLRRREEDPARFPLDRLVQMTKGWTGAEVEQCVVSALTKARLAGHELKFDDLLMTAARIVPLSKTMKEQVDHIRDWARSRAAPASLAE